jgi:hypothetical protein
MSVSDLDVNRSAHLWIQQHGDQALAKAREMVETMRRMAASLRVAVTRSPRPRG